VRETFLFGPPGQTSPLQARVARLFSHWGWALFLLGLVVGWLHEAEYPTRVFARLDDAGVESGGIEERRGAAIFEDPARLNVRQTRLEFEQLGLKMVGMTAFEGRSAAFLQHRGSPRQMVYSQGDVIGGFRIISIQPQYTIFEREGVQLWLALGEATRPDEAVFPTEDLGFLNVAHKRREVSLKTPGEAPVASGLLADLKRSILKVAPALPKGLFDSLPTLKRSQTIKTVVAANQRLEIVESLPAERLSAPARFLRPVVGPISSGFGYRRQPQGGARKYHRGVDIAAPFNSPIRAPAPGYVSKVSRSLSRGLNVLIEHAGGYETAYFHLSRATVKEGQWVAQGDEIGRVGTSGIATGPHLHLEIHLHGQALDPMLYLD